eukprot:1158264-Pelagomonas_calceolata.AAC.8
MTTEAAAVLMRARGSQNRILRLERNTNCADSTQAGDAAGAGAADACANDACARVTEQAT